MQKLSIVICLATAINRFQQRCCHLANNRIHFIRLLLLGKQRNTFRRNFTHQNDYGESRRIDIDVHIMATRSRQIEAPAV